MSTGMDRIRLAFKDESLERLARLGPIVAALSTSSRSLDQLVEQIRSEIHMMKGAAGMLELQAIRDSVAELEEKVCNLPRDRAIPTGTSQALTDDFARLRVMVESIGSSRHDSSS